MLTVEERRVLARGPRMGETWADEDLRRASKSALDKKRAVLPDSERTQLDEIAMFSLSISASDELRAAVGVIRRSIEQRIKVDIA